MVIGCQKKIAAAVNRDLHSPFPRLINIQPKEFSHSRPELQIRRETRTPDPTVVVHVKTGGGNLKTDASLNVQTFPDPERTNNDARGEEILSFPRIRSVHKKGRVVLHFWPDVIGNAEWKVLLKMKLLTE